MGRQLTGNFTLKLGMEVVGEYLNQVMIEFLNLVVVFMCFWSAQQTVLSRSIELVNYNKLDAEIEK